jgi:hypothetical protein
MSGYCYLWINLSWQYFEGNWWVDTVIYGSIYHDNILKVTDEWILLSMDQSRHSLSYKRVDNFWREVFSQTASNDTRKYPTVTGVLRWLWEGLGFQKKKIIRKLTWCKQQKKEDIQRTKLVSEELWLFFLYFSELWKQYIIHL